MARVDITKTVLPGPYPAAGVELVMTAADTSNKNQFVMSGADLMVIRNADAAAKTYKIEGAENLYNRTADLSGSIGAGEMVAFFFNALEPFRQPDGQAYCEGNHTNIKFGVAYGGGLI